MHYMYKIESILSSSSKLGAFLAKIKEGHQYRCLHHGIASSRGKQFFHRLDLGAFHGWTENSRAEHRREVLQRHLVLCLILRHAAHTVQLASKDISVVQEDQTSHCAVTSHIPNK